MTDDGPETTAVTALAEREYERAGDAYTRLAWERLAAPREHLGPFDADEKGWVGRGLRALATAAVAYRVAGVPERATHRAVEGVAVARDLKRSLDRPGQAACLDEFVADFRTCGDLSGAAEAYDDAAAAYREAGPGVDSPQALGTTPLFEAAAATLKQVARSRANGEIAVKWEDIHGSDPADAGAFLARRATYKRQRFADLVAGVVADGYLAAPRGTTEYDNADHRCPDCGSSDVNWTAGRTLCLRCSRPTSER